MSCPVCAHSGYEAKPNLPYVECASCHLYYNPSPPQKVFEAPHEIRGDLMTDHDKEANRQLAVRLASRFQEPITHFDIGSKYPYLSKCLQDLGATTFAMDGIDAAPDFGKQLGVQTLRGDFEEHFSTWKYPTEQTHRDFRQAKFNLVTLVHCFEHFYNPLKSLANVRSLMQTGGILFIRSPDHQVPGIERDYTPGHFSIHPTVWCEEAMAEVLVQLADAFVIEESYPLEPGQRDYILRAINDRPSVGAGYIVKNEESDLPNSLKSIEFVDSVTLVDTGSTDRTLDVAREVRPDLYAEVFTGASTLENGDWKLWNFATARNVYVERVEVKSDWVLWMDADDEVTPEAAAAIKRSLYLPYDIYGFPIQTGPSTRHIHHRLWRSKLHVRYHGAVHEYPSWPVSARVREWGAPIIHHNEPGSGESGIKRNMRILEREIGENPSHRVIFYLANTYRDAYGLEKDKTFLFKALDLYRKYIAAPGSFHDELMFCYIYAARCLRWLGQIEALRQVVREGAAKDATFAELYMEAAFAEYNVGRYWEAISWALQATQCPYKLRLFAERNMYEDQPFRLLAWSFKLLKDPISSLSWGEKVWDYVREDSSWKDFLATILATMKPKSNVVNIHRPGAIGDILALGPTTAGLKALGYKVNLYTAYPEAAKLLSGLTVPDHTWDQRPEGNDLELCGYPIEEGYPHVPMKKPLTTYFCEEAGRKLGLYLDPIYGNGLKSSYERLIDAPYLTFHIKTGWSIYKEWWICNWLALITKLKEAYPSLALVQIGGVDDPKLPIRQETGKTLAHAVGLIKHADLHLGVDSFSNHAAGLLGVPAVILFGSTSPIGSGYPTADNIWANLPCSPCYKENPELSRQSLGPCPHKHECMSSITVDMVFSVVQKRLSEGK